jgi:hypothetical protein
MDYPKSLYETVLVRITCGFHAEKCDEHQLTGALS